MATDLAEAGDGVDRRVTRKFFFVARLDRAEHDATGSVEAVLDEIAVARLEDV